MELLPQLPRFGVILHLSLPNLTASTAPYLGFLDHFTKAHPTEPVRVIAQNLPGNTRRKKCCVLIPVRTIENINDEK